jgi:hypothetical protein
MPRRAFDEDPKEPREQKVKLNQVSSQKSMFDNAPKKTTPQEFQQQVHAQQEKSNSYKVRASKVAVEFGKIMNDKTLSQNKSIFAQEAELEVLSSMIQLAIEINNDPNESEGMGSLGWIALLFRTCLVQRDRANQTEYRVEQLEKKIDSRALTDFIIKEVNAVLDKKKISG